MEQTLAHRTALDEPDAPLSCSECHRPCSMARQRTVVPRSGRRGRRFKSCHPDHSRRSLTCGNAVSCARFSTFQQSRQRPRGNKKEHEGTKKESRGRLRRTEEHRPPSTTQQTRRHRRVLQGTVIPRPQRRGLSGGKSAGQEPVPIRRGASSSGSGLSPSPPGRLAVTKTTGPPSSACWSAGGIALEPALSKRRPL